MIPDTTKEAAIEALTHFDQQLRDAPEWKGWEERESYRYAIEYGGRRYPVKAIVSIATGAPLNSFTGGEEANNWAEKLGFQIVKLRQTEQSKLSVRLPLQEILSQYGSARSSGDFGKGHPIWGAFKQLKNAIADVPAVRNRHTLRVQWSVGKGEWARVPWVAIIDSREVEAPRGGIYCVFLFREDLSAVYLTLNQGVTKPRQEFGPVEASHRLRERAKEIRGRVPELQERGFLLDNHIDLRSAGLGAKYEDSTIAYKLYESDQVPPDTELAEDLGALLSAYANATQPSSRVWIFQANPKLYNIEEALSHLSEINWLVLAYQDRILPGDKVFLWKSGGDAGIVAEGTTITAPSLSELTNEEGEFALDREKFKGTQLRVRVHIDAIITPPLSRHVLKADPRLADLSILKFSQGTNFPVTPEEAAVIRELLNKDHDDTDEVSHSAAPDKLANASRVWAYSPGPKAQFWEEFYRDEIMAIGWDEMGDLRQYPDHKSIANKLVEVYKLKHYPINDSRACFNFVRTIKPGDRVIAKRGKDEVIGYGVVTGEYEYRTERTSFRHVRAVRWERRGNWKGKSLFAVKTLTDFTGYPDEVEYINNLIGVSEVVIEPTPAEKLPPYNIEDALKGVAFDRTQFQEILDTWRSKKNLILQGPPGVGKTFLARRLAYVLLGYDDPSRVEMVQFHQSYSYEDFVQGYRPAESGFSRKDGIFVRFCKRASLDQDSKYVFIIDEINRSNLSKVFGELLVLIEADKRGSKNSLALTYSTSEEEQFYVSPNVFILGLMNTADRSLAMVDYALRRRFAFVELEPLFGSAVFTEYLISCGAKAPLVSAITARMQALNQVIAEDQNLGSGFVIGHSYFCENGAALTSEDYQSAIKHEILPLLKEYWFDDPERVKDWTAKLEMKLD